MTASVPRTLREDLTALADDWERSRVRSRVAFLVAADELRDLLAAHPATAEVTGQGLEAVIADVLAHHLPDSAPEHGCALRCGYDGDEFEDHLAAHVAAAVRAHLEDQ